VRLHKIDASYDPSDKVAAMAYLETRRARGEVVTGLLYVDPDSRDMHAALATVDTPLNALQDADLVPGSTALAAVNASFR
jgi:2-oxoglutarate ferredoxin oxidoreductase subunit beta